VRATSGAAHDAAFDEPVVDRQPRIGEQDNPFQWDDETFFKVVDDVLPGEEMSTLREFFKSFTPEQCIPMLKEALDKTPGVHPFSYYGVTKEYPSVTAPGSYLSQVDNQFAAVISVDGFTPHTIQYTAATIHPIGPGLEGISQNSKFYLPILLYRGICGCKFFVGDGAESGMLAMSPLSMCTTFHTALGSACTTPMTL
jgi:hypothetical protein